MDKHKKQYERITVSFSKENHDLYDLVMQKENISEFICQALREKVEGTTKVEDKNIYFENKVKKIVEKMLSDENITQVEKEIETDNRKKTEIDQDVVNAIKSSYEF